MSFTCKSEAQKRAIRRSYAIRAEKARQQNAKGKSSKLKSKDDKAVSHVGNVYRGETKYIDKDTKKQRNYVVVKETKRGVTVAKLKSIKKFDENGKNADKALAEINHERYGLPNRTGVDFQKFDTNRMSNKPLKLSDKKVFPEDKERFKLNSKDKHNTLIHTQIIVDPKKNKKRGN